MTKRIIKRLPGTMKYNVPEVTSEWQVLSKLKWNPLKCKRGEHTIGILWYYDESHTVLQNSDDILDSGFDPFNFCPCCGKSVKRSIIKTRK